MLRCVIPLLPTDHWCLTHLHSAIVRPVDPCTQGPGPPGSSCRKQAASKRLGNNLGEEMGAGLEFRRAGRWPLTLCLQSLFRLPSLGYTCKDVGQNVRACACASWHSPLAGKSDSKACLCLPGRGA